MSFDPRRLDAGFSVAPQIDVADVAAVAQAGFQVLVCNRPDGEAMLGQPAFDEVAAAARAAGMKTVSLPFRGADFDVDQARALADLIAAGEGPILAYCRSGTRSTILWAAAGVALGRDYEDLSRAAAAAGYDLAAVADRIRDLGEAARR